MMLPIRWDWQKLFSYGEVMCFISAWAVGLVVAWDEPRSMSTPRDTTRAFAAASEVPGMQASIGKRLPR